MPLHHYDRDMTSRAQLIVSGRVQNVGYRVHCAREAKRLGLAGSVRNLADGRVEVFAEGDAGAIDQLAEWCKIGSPFAEVNSVHRTDHEVQGDLHFRLIR